MTVQSEATLTRWRAQCTGGDGCACFAVRWFILLEIRPGGPGGSARRLGPTGGPWSV